MYILPFAKQSKRYYKHYDKGIRKTRQHEQVGLYNYSHVIVTGCPVTTFFSKWRIAVMNDDIAKFGYDRMQQITKNTNFMKSTSPRTFKVIKVFNL